MDKSKAYELISHNIEKFGFHIYLVNGGAAPRFIYTIGLSKKVGFELAFVGGYFFEDSQAVNILEAVANSALNGTLDAVAGFRTKNHGHFRLQAIHSTWITQLFLGMVDFFSDDIPRCYQLLPEEIYSTIDVPDMRKPYGEETHPIWKWLKREWPHSIASESQAVTDLRALKGDLVTEATRWEESEWELFAGAGDEQRQEDLRKVPVSVLLAFDSSLEPVLDLKIGEGLWRDSSSGPWHEWKRQ